jgi:hypothetical protein
MPTLAFPRSFSHKGTREHGSKIEHDADRPVPDTQMTTWVMWTLSTSSHLYRNVFTEMSIVIEEISMSAEKFLEVSIGRRELRQPPE